MKTRIFLLITLAILTGNNIAYADCSGGDGEIYKTFNIGAQYVPRDAPLGSVIGTAELPYTYTYTKELYCANNDTLEMKRNNWPAVTGINAPPLHLDILKAPIVKTNIPGVGLIVNVQNPLGTYSEIISGYPPYIPYKLITRIKKPNRTVLSRLQFSFTLIKISDEIPSGSSDIVNTTTAAYIQLGANRSIGVFLTGAVIRSDCSLEAGHSYVNVFMGDVMRRKFNGKHSYLESKDFSIPLTSCVAGRYPIGQDWNYYQNSSAHIKLEGTQGSLIIDADNGILGLTQASTAKGVAVQVLHKDGVTPLPLGQEVSIGRLSGTSMSIDLKARYIQTSDSTLGLEPGKADARAAFTITYK